MATSANPPPGATPANGAGDPFLGPPSGPLRYASFDTDQFSLYSSNSPSHAKRALEAHLKDTDRRIQDASRLGTTLLQQRKELSARLKDVEQVQVNSEVPDELRTKLAELEREYNEVGKESARAFLPKSRAVGEVGATPTVLTGQARESPTKVSAPSRRQRNQPSNRVHDIEFATEISTSLLAQVRQLQTALSEKDDALKDSTSAHAQLEAEAAGMVQRIKHMDENEQRYKDENWNLETKLQELEGGLRETTDKHDRLSQTVKTTQSEKAAAQRELDDLKVSHEKLSEDHAVVKKQQESDLHGLRRDIASHQTERQTLQQKVQELTSQNTELARAVSYRWNQAPQPPDPADFASAASDRDDADMTPEHSEPPSPVKGTPRHGMLESETLKSSLNHAHRMIQNLKNNIHREKTEKIELKRLLQDARDELDVRRSDSGAGAGGLNGVKKQRRSEPEGIKFRKPARPERLGANRSSTTEILDDDEEPDWEDHEVERTPSKSRYAAIVGTAGGLGAAAAAGGTDAFDHAAFGGEDPAESTTDEAFETANERDSTTEAFETVNEDLGPASDGDLTETEAGGGGLARSGTVRAASGGAYTTLASAKAGDRRSFQSTASTSADEADEVRTPVQAQQQPKYRLRMGGRNGGGSRRSGRVSDLMTESPVGGLLESPTSSNGTPRQALGGQSLGDELDAVDEGSVGGGTPRGLSEDFGGEMLRRGSGGEAEEESPVEEHDAGVEGEADKPTASVEGQEEEEEDEDHEPEISSPVASPQSPKPSGEQAVLAHQANAAMLAHEFALRRANYVDSGVMTDPWEPAEREVRVPQKGQAHHQTLRDRAGEMVGGALAGFGLGRFGHREVVGGGGEEAPVGAGAQEGEERAVVPEEDGVGPEAKVLGDGSVPAAEQAVDAPELADPAAELPVANVEPAGGVVKEESTDARPLGAFPSPPSSAINREPKYLSSAIEEPLSAANRAAETPQEHPLASLEQSGIVSQETEPITPPRPLNFEKRPGPTRSRSGLQRITDAASKPEVPLAAAAPLALRAEERDVVPPQELGFSSIDSQGYEPSALPEVPHTPMLPKRSSRRLDALYSGDDDDEPSSNAQNYRDNLIPGTDSARPGAGFFAAGAPPPPLLVRSRSKSMPASRVESGLSAKEANRSVIEPRVFGGVRSGSSGIPTLVFGDDSDEGVETTMRSHVGMRTPSLRSDTAASNAAQGERRSFSNEGMIPVTKPLQIKKPMADEGSQTLVSGDEIDDMMRNKSRTSSMATSVTDASGLSPSKPSTPTQRRSVDGAVVAADPALAAARGGPRRPASAGSMRNKGVGYMAPPLPEDFTQKITAAAQKGGTSAPPAAAPAGTMGPPLMPASAYKQSNRPKTPADRAYERSLSRDGTTPRPVRPRDSRGQMAVASPSGISRRTSVSSFASELDERFNITRGDLIYPSDVTPATDPRMIQAITQTMIGEYLWKYTRKAGRSETSSTRHRRFFWVHPYTRTLYWSEKDPSTAGRDMLKAKSVAIQAVRVVTDDNAYPPGLHRKSLVVVTPGREIVFTAPTGQRHETWFNALSYLLLRTEQEKGEAEDHFNQEDIDEFNPGGGGGGGGAGGFSIRRSISRMTGGRGGERDRSQSRLSLSSYNSRGTRTSSPQKRREAGGSLAQRQSAAALRGNSREATTPTPSGPVPETGAGASRTSTMRDSQGSVSAAGGGRFSSLTSRFRPSSSQRGSVSTKRGRSSFSSSMRGRSTPGGAGDPSEIYDASVVENESAEDLRAVIERQEREADRLENVRACCDGKHDVGSLSRMGGKGRHGSFASRFGGGGGGGHSHSHSHAHPRAEPIKDSLRPRRGE